MKFLPMASLLALAPFCASPVLATLITFDDLPAQYRLAPIGADDYPDYDPDADDTWVARPLTDQYAHLGLSFGEGDLDHIAHEQSSESGAALTTFDDVVVSGPNGVSSQYTHDGLRFWFVGDELPTHLSFYVSAPAGAMSVRINEVGGTSQVLDLGWTVEDGEFEYTEAPIKHKVEFMSEGVESVRLGNFFGHRSTPVYMDNLYFTSGQAVPEPGSLSLMLAGVLGLVTMPWRRRAI